MQVSKFIRCFSFAVLAAGYAVSASASVSPLTVTSVEQTIPIGIAEANGGFPVPSEIIRSAGGSNVCGNSRSPWSNLTSPNPTLDKGYLSLGPRNRDGGESERQCSFLEIDVGFDASSLSLLWGSPDTYNRITLLNVVDDPIEGVEIVQEIGSVVPSVEGAVPASGTGAYLVSIVSSLDFNRVRVENTSNTSPAFEFSNLIVGASAAGGDLECGDEVSVSDGDLVLQRVDTEGVDCNTQVDYQVGFDGEVLTVLTDPVEGSAYFVELSWGSWVELPQGGAIPAFQENPLTIASAVPLPAHTFGLDLGGNVQGNTYLLDLCPGQPIIVADEIVGYDLASINDGENGDNDMSPKPGFQFACSARRTQLPEFDASLCPGDAPPSDIPDAVCVGFDELIYIEGDWFSSRNLR